MKNRKIMIVCTSILIFVVVFSICNFIYNNYYKIDISPFAYIFTSRIVESPDNQHVVMIKIYKAAEDSNSAYIMGTLGTLDDEKGYTKASKTIFWQKVNSDSIKEKTINDVTLSNWIDAAWLDSQTININGIPVNINHVYDYRRE